MSSPMEGSRHEAPASLDIYIPSVVISIPLTMTASLFNSGSLNKPMNASSMRLMMGFAEPSGLT